MRERAAGHAEGMDEGQLVGIVGPEERAERALVHEGAEREVREHEAPFLLPDQIRGFAAEHPPAPAEMRLKFVEGRLHLPPLVIERGQFVRGRARRLEHGGDQ